MSTSKTFVDTNGYLKYKDSGKLVHRHIMEQKLGRKLAPGEIVHHKNGNRQDNRPENLEVTTKKEHFKTHVVPVIQAEKQRVLDISQPTTWRACLKCGRLNHFENPRCSYCAAAMKR